jgi:formamidopyrimidine-DNA glycosylase
MPELPEVETTLRGIRPHVIRQRIDTITIRQHRLRWPVPSDLSARAHQQTIHTLSRRGKYLLLHLESGILLMHLGMSGRLCIVPPEHPPQKHDHVDIHFQHAIVLRYTDPRRFGAVLWLEPDEIDTHPLLSRLGVEPFADAFTGLYLWQLAQKRTLPIKAFIMNQQIVVGVGNIYATEALFMTGIHPLTPTHQVSLTQFVELVSQIQQILKHAIAQGGTTLKDFLSAQNKPGYFSQQLRAYGRAGLPCTQCQEPLQTCTVGQRASAFCARCQKC